MYRVGVREHVMIAHGFRGELFGPAQRLHGATYVVDVEFVSPKIDVNGVVVDIARATDALKQVLSEMHYRNLDELPVFAGQNTTTEFLARFVFDRLAGKLVKGELGSGSEDVGSIKVTFHESHVAWASYEGAVAR